MLVFFGVAALVLVTLGGQAIPTPGGAKQYDTVHKFETMAQCRQYLDTDAGRLSRQELAAMIVGRFDAEHIPSLQITVACHKFMKKPDGSLAEENEFKDDTPQDQNSGDGRTPHGEKL